jgi:hypothetical protein
MSVLMPTEVRLDKLKYETPVKQKGYHKSLISYGELTEESVLLQTPLLKLKLNDPLSNNGINLVISRNKKQSKFYSILKSLEYDAIKTMVNNSKKWFGRQATVEKIKTMFKSCLVNPETMNGDFTFKVRKDRELQIYNSKKQITNEDDLVNSKNNLLCLLKINGILFGRNTAKLDIRIVQIRICPEPPKLPKGCNVTNDSDNESENESDIDSDMDDFDFEPKEETRDVQVELPVKYLETNKPQSDSTAPSERAQSDSTAPERQSETEPIVTKQAESEEEDIDEHIQPQVPPQIPEPEEGVEEEGVEEEGGGVVDQIVETVTNLVSGTDTEQEFKSVAESDFETRLSSLRTELAKCVADNDTQRVEEIACEIVQLKLSN